MDGRTYNSTLFEDDEIGRVAFARCSPVIDGFDQVSRVFIASALVVHAASSARLQGLQGIQGPLQLFARRDVRALPASRIDM